MDKPGGKKHRAVTFGTHFWTLMWKNWMLKKRHWVATILEISLPVLFIIMMSGLKTLTSNVDVHAGWSDTTASTSKTIGTSYPLTDPDGDGSSEYNFPFGYPVWGNKYLISETTMSGVLMYLGMQTAKEIRVVGISGTNLSTTQVVQCRKSLVLFGLTSTNTSSSSAIPSECRDHVTPYKIAIAPDTTFTRKYFLEAMKLWYPRVAISNATVTGSTSKVTLPSFEDSVVFFSTEAALNTYIKAVGYGKSIDTPKIYAALVFDQYPADSDIGKYQTIEYSVRMNSTEGKGGSVGTVPRTIGDPAFETPLLKSVDTDYYSRYAMRGFMSLQTLVTRFVNCMPVWDLTTSTTTGVCQQQKSVAVNDSTVNDMLFEAIQSDFYILTGMPYAFDMNTTKTLNELNAMSYVDREALLVPLRQAPQAYFGSAVAAFPIESYVSAPFYDSVSNVFPLVFILAYLYAISRVLVVFIQEKETRSREYMKILGVSEGSIIFSWYVTYTLIFVIGAILQALASSAGLFANSQPGLIFIFFFLFGMSVLGFGFLMSTLFSRSRTGAFAGMVLFFFMYFVSSAFSASSSIHSKSAACLLAPVALAFGVQTLASAESSGVGINSGNVRTVVDNFSFNVSIGMLFFDLVWYTLLGLYLERVIPKEYGTTEVWYFPVSPSYWGCISKKQTQKVGDMVDVPEEIIHMESPNIEPVSAELGQQVQSGEALVINNIQKEFAVPGGIKKAVRGVSLTMYKDQITCLLGHNGAGKTTLISMLTGMIAPSDGDAYFHGLSLTKDMSKIRQSLGLCFQHDVLYSELSVEEHLRFYARLKGYKGKDLKDEIDKKIKEVGLTEKRKVWSSALSGGMKRKLSVAICLLGDSSLVFLDEPTSGMDPYSRRSTWYVSIVSSRAVKVLTLTHCLFSHNREILINNRQNRVMVLTTHFMDEADILGDRIAIMAEGQLRCCGTSLFLKNRYGAGYHFTLVKRENCPEKQLIDLVTARVTDAKILSNVGAEISFQLPLNGTAQFAVLFEELDGRLDGLGVLSYGISVTTLEEVFIKVAEAGDEDNQHTLNKDAMAKKDAPSGSTGPSIANLTGWYMFSVHLSALLLKRFRIARRDRRVLLFGAILPVILMVAGLGLLKSSSLTKSDPKLELSSTKFSTGTSMSVPYYCEADDADWCSYTMDSLFAGGNTSKFTSAAFGSPGFSSSTPTVFNVTYSTSNLNTTGSTGQCLRMSEKIYQRAFGKTDADMAKTTVTPVKGQYGGYLLHASGIEKLFGYHIFVNSTATHGSIIFKALLDQALYRLMAVNASTSATSDIELKVNTYPLPATASTAALFGSFLSFTACLFIVIAFAFFPASIVTFLVKEKQAEHNSKHQQLVSGVSLPAFWLANYIWDLLTYVIPFIAAIALIQLFAVSALAGTSDCISCTSNTYPAVVLLFVLFGLAICPFTYCMSYMFKEHASSQTYTIMINFIIGVVLMVVSFILDVISDSSKSANKVLKFIWRLSPLYCLGSGLLNQCLLEIKASFGLSTTETAFDMDIMGWEMLYLAIDAVLFICIAVGIDFLLSFPKIKAMVFKDPKLVDAPYEEDEDVMREAMRVSSGGADNDAVKLHQIRKVYQGNKVAVRNISFGLHKGECFGYLGINGAGKTTTMKMLTGDILPTSGQATLGGFDILSQQLEVRRLIGYCPQFDALFELLSVREHLELFARIKGVSSANLDAVVKDLMHQMNLDDFENKLAGTLSGGNKRKLSVAIAMIGSPPIIFLDEPSTGMDPVSRRFMWNVIADMSTTRKESTIVLTTHSMEECEALCTRVGIMVGGRLRCLGSVQHLKNRFGDGLMVEIKLDQAPISDVEARVAQVFGPSGPTTLTREELRSACEKMGNATWFDKIAPIHSTGFALAAVLERDGHVRVAPFCSWWIAEERIHALDLFLKQCFGEANAALVELQNDLCRYKLTGKADTIKLSNVFRLVENGKVQNHIREYAVSQTTLEQIFNTFASQQSEETGVARGMIK